MPSSYRKANRRRVLTIQLVWAPDEDFLEVDVTTAGTGEMTQHDRRTLPLADVATDELAAVIGCVVSAHAEVSSSAALSQALYLGRRP